jgi:hypothetical protein
VAAGLEHHRVHDLRHTFAVNSLRAGDDIKTIQENMGNYSAAFTLDRYGHVTETMRQENANRMQAVSSEAAFLRIKLWTGKNKMNTSGFMESALRYWR